MKLAFKCFTVVLLLLFKSQCCIAQDDSSDNVIDQAWFLLNINTDSANGYLDSIGSKIDSLNASNVYASYLTVKGRKWLYESKFDLATKAYLKALSIYEKNGIPRELANMYDQMAYLYQRLRLHDNYKDYALRAIKLKKQSGNNNEIASSLYILGNYYFYQKNYDSAKYKYEQSLALRPKRDTSFVPKLLYVLGNCQMQTGSLDSAYSLYSQSLKLYEDLSDKRGSIYPLLRMSYYHFIKKDAIKADSVLDIIEHKFVGLVDTELISTYYGYRSYSKQLLGDTTSILLFKKMQYDSTTHFISQKGIQTVKTLEEQFKRDKKVLASITQRNISIVIGISVLIVSITGFLSFKQRLRNRRLEIGLKNEKINTLEKEKQLVSISAVLEGQEVERRRVAQDLHDGLGVLLTSAKFGMGKIEKLATELNASSDYDTVSEQIDEACNEVRKIAHNMMPGTLIKFGLKVAIEELVHQINGSFELQITSDIEIDDVKMSENQEIMLYRVIQELVNNTVKHSKASMSYVSMDILNKETIRLQYSDNGIGFDSKSTNDGIGLDGIRSRVALLNGSINIQSQIGMGVKFTILT